MVKFVHSWLKVICCVCQISVNQMAELLGYKQENMPIPLFATIYRLTQVLEEAKKENTHFVTSVSHGQVSQFEALVSELWRCTHNHYTLFKIDEMFSNLIKEGGTKSIFRYLYICFHFSMLDREKVPQLIENCLTLVDDPVVITMKGVILAAHGEYSCARQVLQTVHSKGSILLSWLDSKAVGGPKLTEPDRSKNPFLHVDVIHAVFSAILRCLNMEDYARKRAYVFDPIQQLTFVMESAMCWELGAYDNLITYTSELIERGNESCCVYLAQGIGYYQLGLISDALETLRASVKVDKQFDLPVRALLLCVDKLRISGEKKIDILEDLVKDFPSCHLFENVKAQLTDCGGEGKTTNENWLYTPPINQRSWQVAELRNEDPHYIRGATALQRGDTDRAFNYFQEAIDLNPLDSHRCIVQVTKLLGQVSGRTLLSRFDDTFAAKEDHSLLFRKGLVHFLSNQNIQALKMFNRACTIFPNNSVYQNYKGLSMGRLSMFEEALDAFQQAMNFNPYDPEYLSNQGLLLFEMKCYEEALESFNKAINLDQKNVTYRTHQVLTLEALVRHTEALKSCTVLIDLKPARAQSWALKGSVCIKINQQQEALDCLNKAIELDPTCCDYYISKVPILKKQRLLQECLDCLDIALTLDPTNEVYRTQKTELLRGSGSSLRGNNEIEDVCSNNSEVILQESQTLWQVGRHEEAIDLLTTAISLHPHHVNLYLKKGSILYDLKRREEAVDCYNEALHLMPNRVSLYYAKAECLGRIARRKEGLHCCDRGLELNPTDANLLFKKSSLLWQLRRWREAVQVTERVKALDSKVWAEKMKTEIQMEFQRGRVKSFFVQKFGTGSSS